MHSLRRASGALFYFLGALVITGIVLVQRGVYAEQAFAFLSIADLPLVLFGMLYGGSTLVTSLGKDRSTLGLTIAVFLPLAVLFVLFAFLNFAMPFAEV